MNTSTPHILRFLSIVALLGATVLSAGPGRRAFDPSSAITVEGKVTAVQSRRSRSGYGIHLMLASADKTYDIHVGPAWYLNRKKIAYRKGDALTVNGFRIGAPDSLNVVARTITKGTATVTLRDETGRPMWAGSGRGRGQGRGKGGGGGKGP